MPLSVVIPSYNRPDLLTACLATVTRYAPEGTEVLVVDDASPGQAVSRAAEAFPGVNVLRRTRRRGFCATVNAGIRAARGDVVELLNDDTEVSPGWADAALAHFADPGVGAVAPLVLMHPASSPGPERIDSAGDRYYRGGVAGKRGHGRILTEEYLQPRRVFGASGSSAFYRRQALLEVGAFPESFRAYFEDVDVAFRLHRAGYATAYEPASRVYHHVGASHGRTGRRLLEQQSLNEERVFWRNLPAAALARALPYHAAVLLGKSWRRWQDGGLVPFACGRLRLLGEIPELLRHRAALARTGTSHDPAAWGVEGRYWGSAKDTGGHRRFAEALQPKTLL